MSWSIERAAGSSGAAPDCSQILWACQTEHVLATLVTYLTFFAELCGALVIAVGTVRALLRFVAHLFQREAESDRVKEHIRLQLGKSLALALEFELGADILKTAVAPSLPVIGQLAAIIVLRTMLNYFLERELRQSVQPAVAGRSSAAPSQDGGLPP